jgi:hypothetical protein
MPQRLPASALCGDTRVHVLYKDVIASKLQPSIDNINKKRSLEQLGSAPSGLAHEE